MVFKRFKRQSKKRIFRKRFSRRGRNSFKKGQRVHLFKRTVITDVAVNVPSTTPFLQPVSATGTFNSFIFQQLNGYEEFQTLYDSYKVCAIKCKFIYERNSADSTTNPIPNLISVNDYNDSISTQTEQELVQYTSFKSSRMNGVVKRYYKPQQVITSSPLVVGKPTWLPTTNITQVFYGLKSYISSQLKATALGNVKVYTTIYFMCKNTK